jgi:hypothetical protein
MGAKNQESDFFAAVTTEHFVMQTNVSATLSEAQSRAGMFTSVLTGTLIAMGFTTQSMDVLVPFVATVLPAVFIMGAITVLRLTDISMESSVAHIGIARIRRQYRSLGTEAESFFDARLGRWPENISNPSIRLGSFVAYWTSAAAMVAVIDALVGASAVTLLLKLGADLGLLTSLLAGGAFGVAVLLAFFYYQKLRIAELNRLAKEVQAYPRIRARLASNSGVG